MSDWTTSETISFWTAIIQLGGIVGLAVYCVETYRLRRAAQEQVRAAQAQAKSAQDQAEGQNMPCLLLEAAARDFDDTVLEMSDAVGSMVIEKPGVRIKNIGTGPAIDVRYDFLELDAKNAPVAKGSYLQGMPVGYVFKLAFPQSLLANATYEFVASYSSLSGRRYESHLTITDRVITKVVFRNASPSQAQI